MMKEHRLDRDADDDLDMFKRDKRKRRVAVEAVSSSPRSVRSPQVAKEGGAREERAKEGGARRSFNPNFSPDNKFVGGGTKSERPALRTGEAKSPNRGKDYGAVKPFSKDKDKPFGKTKDKPFAKQKSSSFAMNAGDTPKSYPSYEEPKTSGDVRLNRYIAMAGKSSRREADQYIAAGKVTVNGVKVTELGVKIKQGDEVRLSGELLSGEKKVYILMNKPKGFVTTVEDPHAEKTVMDIIRNACAERVFPVGRLDKNSLGVLLITNDGPLTERLTHPSHNKRKVYQVALDVPITRADMERILAGVELEDGPIAADSIDYVSENRREVGIEIHSGRNRVVRRIFESLGYNVRKLDRVYFAGLTKKNLKRGQWRFLTDKEVAMLKTGRYE